MREGSELREIINSKSVFFAVQFKTPLNKLIMQNIIDGNSISYIIEVYIADKNMKLLKG